jgi:hypothetical protein
MGSEPMVRPCVAVTIKTTVASQAACLIGKGFRNLRFLPSYCNAVVEISSSEGIQSSWRNGLLLVVMKHLMKHV